MTGPWGRTAALSSLLLVSCHAPPDPSSGEDSRPSPDPAGVEAAAPAPSRSAPPASVRSPEASPPISPEVAALIRQLGDLSWEKREEATEKLALLGEDVLPALRAALTDDDGEIRSRAAMVIDVIRLGVTPELRAKVGTLLNGFDALGADAKRDVLDRLVRAGGRSAVPALERILRVEADEPILEEVLRRLESLDEAASRRALARLVASPAARPWHVEAHARRMAWRGDLAGALAAYEEALARRIDRPSLQLAYAETLLAAGRPARAASVLERLETDGHLPANGEERARAYYWLAESLFAVGRFADALGRYEAAAGGWLPTSEEWSVGREDPFAMAAQRMGECLRRLGRSPEAEARWLVLLGSGDAGGVDDNGRLRVAELLRRDGQTDRALAIVRQVSRAGPDNERIPLLNRAAQIFAYAGRAEEALALQRRLTRDDGSLLFPPFVELLLRIVGRPAEALAVRRAGLATAPNDVAQHLEVAAAAERGGLFEEAEALYRQTLDRFPAFPMPRLRLAELYVRLGEHRKALDLGVLPVGPALLCHEALGEVDAGIALGERHRADRAGRAAKPGMRDETDLQPMLTLSRLYRRKGQPERAIECLAGLQGEDAGLARSFDVHLELGRARESAGEAAEAIVEYLLAWQHAGLRAMDIQEARHRAGYLAAQDPAAARAALDAFRRRPGAASRPGDADDLVEAELLRLAGDPLAAAEQIERADARLPRRPALGCRAAQLLARGGKPAEARRRLARVIAEWPEDPVAYRVLEGLASEAGDAEAADGFRAKADAAGALDKKACFEAAHHFMMTGDLAWARAEWSKVIAAPGERFYYDTNAHEYLGHLAIQSGDGAAVEEGFRRVLQERELRESGTVEEGGVPYAALVHYGAGLVAEAQGERLAAAGAFAKALRLAPRFPDLHEALARVLPEAPAREAHHATAVALWRDRIADAPRDPEPRFRLALLLDRTAGGDGAVRDEARRLAREALDRWPGDARYEALARRLDGEPPRSGRAPEGRRRPSGFVRGKEMGVTH